MSRFTIKLSAENPYYINKPTPLGYPDPIYMYANLFICEKTNTAYGVEINNNILREVLLENKEFCEKYLGLVVFDSATYKSTIQKNKPSIKESKQKVKPQVNKQPKDIITIDETMVNEHPELQKHLGKQVNKELLATLIKQEV